MINFPKECPTVKEGINNAADQIGTLFATMHLKKPGMTLNVAAEQLGKCIIMSLTIFVYCYTSTLLNSIHTICKWYVTFLLWPPLFTTQGFFFILQKELANQMQNNMTKRIKKKSDNMGSRPMFEWYIWVNNTCMTLLKFWPNTAYIPLWMSVARHLLPSSQHYISIIQWIPTPTSIHQNLLGKRHGHLSNDLKELNVRFLLSDLSEVRQNWVGFPSLWTTSSTPHRITSAKKQSISMELGIPNQIRKTGAPSTISTWSY